MRGLVSGGVADPLLGGFPVVRCAVFGGIVHFQSLADGFGHRLGRVPGGTLGGPADRPLSQPVCVGRCDSIDGWPELPFGSVGDLGVL